MSLVVGLPSMSMPTPEQLAALPADFLAEDKGQKLMDAAIAITVFITIFFTLFLSARIGWSERNGWDIWLFYPLSFLSSLGLCICCFLYVELAGVGRHFAYWLINDPTKIATTLQIQAGAEFLYIVGVTSPKISLLILYLKIFIDRNVRIWTYVTIGLVLAHFVATGFGTYFGVCQPFAFKWDKAIPDGRCGDIIAIYRYASIPNIITDLLILLLPLPSLRKLHINKMRKAGIIATFLMGSLGLITSIVRFVGFFTVDLEADLTYHTADTMIYTLIETSAYFICSCLPGIRPLARALYKKAGFSTLGTKEGSSHPSRSHQTGDISLAHFNVSHKTTVSSTPGKNTRSMDSDRDGFIRLEETVQVDFSAAPSSRDGDSMHYAERSV
ncbi:Satratoxin biosynthesis SC12 cluster protein [Paramyrothecium foliicola]|nr:Satratoxin biosynthesis SC12 cluster protein [Paramyrothecium foliicola]